MYYNKLKILKSFVQFVIVPINRAENWSATLCSEIHYLQYMLGFKGVDQRGLIRGRLEGVGNYIKVQK